MPPLPEGPDTSKPSVQFSGRSEHSSKRKGVIYGSPKPQGVESSWVAGLSPRAVCGHMPRSATCPVCRGSGDHRVTAWRSQQAVRRHGQSTPGGLLEGGAVGSLQASSSEKGLPEGRGDSLTAESFRHDALRSQVSSPCATSQWLLHDGRHHPRAQERGRPERRDPGPPQTALGKARHTRRPPVSHGAGHGAHGRPPRGGPPGLRRLAPPSPRPRRGQRGSPRPASMFHLQGQPRGPGEECLGSG